MYFFLILHTLRYSILHIKANTHAHLCMCWRVPKVLGTRKKRRKQFTLRTWAIHTPHAEYLLHYDELPFNDARASACLISQISLHLALSTSSLCQMLCAPIISVNSRCNFCFYQAGVLRISSCTALGCALKWRGRLRGGGTVKLDGYRAGTTTKHTSCSPDAFTISASLRIYIHMGFAY